MQDEYTNNSLSLTEMKEQGVLGATLWDVETSEERPLKRPFWYWDNASEKHAIRQSLLRRFPQTIPILAECLETVDPMDMVYPGNPGEYDAVVLEMIVLLAPVDGDLQALSLDQICDTIREGMARHFDEIPVEEKLQASADLIMSRVRS